jgi:integrase
LGKLNARAISRLRKPGMHGDGNGLYLQIGGAGARSWIFRYTLHGRERYLGLGSATAISLKRARELAVEAQALRAQGIDPIEARKDARTKARLAAARSLTFRECAERFVAAHEASWRNAKHRQQWRSTLDYTYPLIGNLPVADIDTALVLKTLEPIWQTKPETARRLRGRIEAVLDWARVAGYRAGENPARWRGNLTHLLPRKRRDVKHHAALSYAEIPAFMAKLATRDSISARCLEVTILTALRSGEALGATWDEIDLRAAVWTVPEQRMKGGKAHRVPLSARVTEILRELAEHRESDLVFPSQRIGRPLSSAAMPKVLAALGRAEVTVHGFRSSFRDWAAEQTNFPRELAEKVLAHATGDETERAYQRGDLFEKRRKLMQAWAAYCLSTPRNDAVVPMRRSAVL